MWRILKNKQIGEEVSASYRLDKILELEKFTEVRWL